jgi:hypothetical protein
MVTTTTSEQFNQLQAAKNLAYISVQGQRQPDHSLRVGGVRMRAFPLTIHVEFASFDFVDEEETDSKTGNCLGWYLRK